MSHWLKTPHWSSDIPLDTAHPRLDALDARGFARLRDLEVPIPESEYLALEYMDWKSGGDTNFAPIATADGELDCRGFWKPGDERPDKDGKFTINAERCPEIKRYVEAVGANFGRVRVIKLEPQDPAGSETCARSLRHQLHQLFRGHAGFFGHLYGHSVAGSINRNDAELFGRLPQPRISK